MQKLIGYRRVSTQKQGKSGLGLEAQQAALEAFGKQQNASIVAVYTEVESGKTSDRQQLLKAIAHAKRSRAILCVAKLDRLSRNVAFLSTLMETGVEFVACDNPHATKFTVHILAAVAEHERDMISQRTKAALAAVKARGVLLGSHRIGHWAGKEQARLDGLNKARSKASKSIKLAAIGAYSDILPLVQEKRDLGLSLQQIAHDLNDMGHTTRNGASWSHVQVMRLLRRA